MIQYELFKNPAGAVFVCIERAEFNPAGQIVIKAGFAFCNPRNLPGSKLTKEEWPRLGWRIAGNRFRDKPVTMVIPAELEDLSWRSRVRATLRRVLWETPWEDLGCRQYDGLTEKSELYHWRLDFVCRLRTMVAAQRDHG